MPEVPANAPEATVSVPAETSVAPVKPLAPVSVRLPAPSLVSVPVPPIALAAVRSLLRLKTSAALLVTAPEPKAPVVPPSPTCRTPAEIVVTPE